MSLEVRLFTGPEILAAIDDLARLRMTVFAEWPYLYDGDPAYEADYLREFVKADHAVLVAACDGSRIVGAATAWPLVAQDADFRAPFAAHGFDPSRLFYFGESVLMAEYRGRGIGHAFFDHREAQARACGAEAACFAAVIRAPDHPARPEGYVSLDGFWGRRGYAPVERLLTHIAWKDHDEPDESAKPLQVWLRTL